jgi:T5SS/PEP-CTERM-associated repeat protein
MKVQGTKAKVVFEGASRVLQVSLCIPYVWVSGMDLGVEKRAAPAKQKILIQCLRALAAGLFLLAPLSTLEAAITATGNVDPDLSSWSTASFNYVGKTSDGSLTVDSDSDLQFGYGYLGYNSGVNGAMTVTDSGSTATGQGDLAVGWVGNGTLNITNGGAVNVSRTTYVGRYSGSTSTINFGGDGGTLTTGSLAASPSQWDRH